MDEEEDDGGGGGEGAPAWMATFSDLATLLLTFFVLLLSFAELNVTEFKEMLGSVREAFGVQFKTQGHIEAMSTTPIALNEIPAANVTVEQEEAVEEVEDLVERENLQDEVEVEAGEGGVIVRIRDQLLFEAGSADLDPDVAGEVLRKVAQLGESFRGEITISGHTDDRPISTSRYPSNWELSSARATAVLRFLLGETELSRDRVHIAGYADTQPIAENDSRENRARNRRVEFQFLRSVEPETIGGADEEASSDEEGEREGEEEGDRPSVFDAINGLQPPE